MSSAPILLDSSAWIEILGDLARSASCQRELKGASQVLVPTIVMYEVYRKIASSVSEDHALQAAAMLARYKLQDLTKEVALTAADISLEHKLGMADSMVLAHAVVGGATLVTLDNDFAGIMGVKVIRK